MFQACPLSTKRFKLGHYQPPLLMIQSTETHLNTISPALFVKCYKQITLSINRVKIRPKSI